MTDKNGELYAVDDVLACKRVGGKFYYRIRWSGYGAADDTWEGKECFTAGSLSHFRPRLNALEQLWLNSSSGSTRQQNVKSKASGTGNRDRRRKKTLRKKEEAPAARKSKPAKSSKTGKSNSGKTTRTERRNEKRRH